MVNITTRPASGTVEFDGSAGIPTPAASTIGYIWASGTSNVGLYYTDGAASPVTTQINAAAGGGGTFTGEVTAGYIPIAKTTTDVLEEFVLGLAENNSIYIGSNPAGNTPFTDETCNTVDEDETVTHVLNALIVVGLTVSGTNVPAGTTIATITDTTHFELSAEATGTGLVTLTFDGAASSNVALGVEALDAITTGDNNVAIGYQAASSLTTGIDNVYIGEQAGKLNVDGVYNVGIGDEALYTNDGGYGNIGLGHHAGRAGTGDYNTYLGFGAGASVAAGTHNVGIGYRSLYSATTGTGSIAIGYYAGRYPEGTYNTFVGHEAGKGSTSVRTAYSNVGIGREALNDVTAGHKNVAVGYQTLDADTTGHSNTAMGYQALSAATVGAENVAIGAYAGKAYVGTTSSVYGGLSVFVGHTAGFQLTGNASYGSVCVVGHAAGYSATGANKITAIGNSAMYYADGALNTTAVGRIAGAYDEGTGSVWVGDSAGYRISGNYNVAVGYEALSGASSGTGFGTAANNVAIGRQAGAGATSANNNVLIGYKSGYDLTTGYDNVGIGREALENITTGIGNTALGRTTLYSLTTGTYNVAVGNTAGYSATTGTGNVMLGHQAGYDLTTGSQNVLIGEEAGENLVGGGYNVAIGSDAMKTATAATYTIAIGKNAMSSGLVTANQMIGIGYNALANATSSDETVAIGGYSGDAITTANYNTFVGYNSASQLTTSPNNTAIGHSAMLGHATQDTTSESNVAIGKNAMYLASGANYNVAVGEGALSGSTAMEGDSNAAVGRQALANTTTGHSNAALGYQAGYNVTTALRSQFIGHSAAGSVTTAQYVTAIGYQAGHSLQTTGNNVLIGAKAGRELTKDYCTFIGVNAGSGTTTGLNNTYIGASAAKNSSTGYYNVAVGNNAGNYLSGSTEYTAIGYYAGAYVSGNYNTFGGAFSGYGDGTQTTNTAHSNAAWGWSTLRTVTSGDRNAALGYNAGRNVTTGDNNTFVGKDAGLTNTTGGGNVFIGYLAGSDVAADGDNKLFIANAAGTPLIGGDFSTSRVGIATGSPGTSLQINNTGTIKNINNILTIEETIGNSAADNEDTGGAILFKGYNWDATPANATSVGLGQIDVTHVNGMTTGSATHDGIMNFNTAVNGTLTTQFSVGYDGNGNDVRLFGTATRTTGASGIYYPNINNAYFIFGAESSHTDGAGTTKPAGMSTDGNPDHTTGGGDQQLHIFTQDDLSLSAGNYGKNAGNRIKFSTTETAYTGSTERMTILGGGNVGIGTAAPTSKLHVAGDVLINDNTGLTVSGSKTNYGIITAYNMSDEPLMNLHSNRSGFGPKIRMIGMDTTGDLGGMAFQGPPKNTYYHTYAMISAGISSTTTDEEEGYLAFTTSQDGSTAEVMRIDGNGRVGIGTTAPGFPLSVSGTQYDMVKIASSHTAGACLYLDADATGGSNWHLQSTADGAGTGGGKLDFVDAGTSRMVIDSAGDVGIGTVAPAHKLDVVGTTQLSGNSIIDGQLLNITKTAKMDISGDYTLSTSYSHYTVTSVAGDVPGDVNVRITTAASPTVGDEYWIVGSTYHGPGPQTGAATIDIIANTGQTINKVGSSIELAATASTGTETTANFRMAHLLCVAANTWALFLTDYGPTS